MCPINVLAFLKSIAVISRCKTIQFRVLVWSIEFESCIYIKIIFQKKKSRMLEPFCDEDSYLKDREVEELRQSRSITEFYSGLI